MVKSSYESRKTYHLPDKFKGRIVHEGVLSARDVFRDMLAALLEAARLYVLSGPTALQEPAHLHEDVLGHGLNMIAHMPACRPDLLNMSGKVGDVTLEDAFHQVRRALGDVSPEGWTFRSINNHSSLGPLAPGLWGFIPERSEVTYARQLHPSRQEHEGFRFECFLGDNVKVSDAQLFPFLLPRAVQSEPYKESRKRRGEDFVHRLRIMDHQPEFFVQTGKPREDFSK